MTKVIILGESSVKEKKEPIQFKKMLIGTTWEDSVTSPHAWNNIILLERKYHEDLDLMYASDADGDGVLHLGHFNDGIV